MPDFDFSPLYKSFSLLTPIDPVEWDAFQAALKVKTFDKDQIVLQQDATDPFIGFMLEGLAYSYYGQDNGKMFTKRFYGPGNIMAPWASYIQNKPSNFSVRTLERTVLVVLPFAKMKEFEQRHLCWSILSKKFTELAFVEREQREYNTHVLSIEERYEFFVKQFQSIADRLPQYLIASYLGINAVTLSRVKNSKKK